MNVNPSGPQNIRPDGVPTGPARTRPYRAAAGGGEPDRPDLSSKAQEFVKMRRDLEALPAPSRAERIAALRELIARGAYAVDGERIAGAMLRDRATARALGLTPSL